MNNLLRRRDSNLTKLPRESFFAPFEQVFNQIINEFESPTFFDRVKANSGFPKMNISETGNEFAITVNVAGVSPEDLNIEIEDNYLRISGKAHEQVENNKETWFYVRELTQKQFTREVKLPENIEGEPVANVKNGILTLTWKLPEVIEKKPKTIKIDNWTS